MRRYIGGSLLGIFLFLLPVYGDQSLTQTFTVDTTKIPPGPHTFRVDAYDAAGNKGSAEITLIVEDITAPVVMVTQPVDQSRVSGVVTITATAQDIGDIARMEILLDTLVLAQGTDRQLSVRWRTGFTSAGRHRITARATDHSGNIGTHEISVCVRRKC